ncbi:MAG: hypothetical protein R3297_04005, partial [Desulfobulbales bacterium]|nr:hypothetical protein [Desulfobulbales bacterium]
MRTGKNLQAWLTLHLVPGMGPITCHKLVAHFGSPDKVLSAKTSALKTVCRLRPESLAALDADGLKNLQTLAQQEIKRAADNNISI